MMRVTHAGVCVVLALLIPAQDGPAAAAVSCASLGTLALPRATVTSAAEIAAGGFMPPSSTPGGSVAPALAKAMAALPAFCRVAVTSKPTADSDIKIEAWLPASGWNGKFQAVGNGGWAGNISYPAMAAAVARGYASASTDTGHSKPGASFGVGHPEKVADFAHRSLHGLAVHAKAAVSEYYGHTPTASVWNGCSTGGNQGLPLASMYPGDFDAIVAGASPGPRARLH